MDKYLNADIEAGKIFYQKFYHKGKIVMLNLLKFKQEADYSNLSELKPKSIISGAEAYNIYIKHSLPELTKVGSEILYFGKSNQFLIGPEKEKWDAVLLMKHESVNAFIEFSKNKNYLKTVGHRTAALENVRLLPTIKLDY